MITLTDTLIATMPLEDCFLQPLRLQTLRSPLSPKTGAVRLLPHSVLDWFKGQKDVLFHNSPISSEKDIAFALEKCVNANATTNPVKSGEANDKLQYILRSAG
jgi:hypothetical protein